MSIYKRDEFNHSFGTWPLTGDVLRKAIDTAVTAGYRSFDTARMYQNEADLGAALAQILPTHSISRDEVCITTKMHFEQSENESVFINSVEASLKYLQIDKLDVLLLHWPPVGGDIAPSLTYLQKAYEMGLTSNIGVSNYTIEMLQRAVNIISAPIITNQVEFHPLLDQSKLHNAANALGIQLSAYCSLARGAVFKSQVLQDIGQKYQKTAGQVVLRWILQKGVTINSSSSKPENIKANFDIIDFELSDDDMAQINGLNSLNQRIVTKDIVPFVPDFD
jgi:2,5-diketo-D-gluconate reductase B